MRPCTCFRLCQNELGFSSLEFVVASLIAMLGVFGSIGLYSTVGSRNHSMELNRGTHVVRDGVKRALSLDLKKHWLALSAQACHNTNVVFTSNAFTATQYQSQILDLLSLESILPKTRANGSGHPVRQAIDLLINNYSAQAAQKCSDATVLKLPQYSVIGLSPMNQALCRCASAVTPYGTLQPKLTNFPNQAGLYACLRISASNSASNTINTFSELQNGLVIAETNYSLLNVTDNSTPTCLQLAGVAPPTTVSRLNYAFYIQEDGVQARGVRIPGSFLME